MTHTQPLNVRLHGAECAIYNYTKARWVAWIISASNPTGASILLNNACSGQGPESLPLRQTRLTTGHRITKSRKAFPLDLSLISTNHTNIIDTNKLAMVQFEGRERCSLTTSMRGRVSPPQQYGGAAADISGLNFAQEMIANNDKKTGSVWKPHRCHCKSVS